jgi:N-acetyl-gamma-glutamylphosphate reductase
MLATKSFIGQRLDMEHYKNVSMNRTIEVFDSDDVSYDLGSLDVIFEFFAKPHGTSLETFNLGDATDNLIVFIDEVLDYRPGIYYHECYQMSDASPSLKVLLFYGVSEII